jgi:hypothetical protein
MRSIIRLLVMMAVTWSNAQGQFIQQGGKLIGSGALGIANQGQSLSLSGDGATAIVGAPFDSSGTGAAWLFVRSNGVWTQQGQKLVGSGSINGTNGARQGTSVALSSDGNTAIVGGTGDNSGAGAAWIFTRAGGLWSQEGEKLVGTGAVDGFIGARQGESVSLSADGNTAIVGGPLDSSGAGASWVFTRTNGIWTQQGSKLVAGTASGEAVQGWSVALSGDGNTAIVGGIYDFNNAGAAWIFVRSNGSWTQQGFKLYGLDAGEGANQGWSVALSGDGNTAIMGGSGDIGGTGAAWVFTRSNGVWSQEGGKLVGTGASGLAGQGGSVALSADGNTAIVGGPGDSLAEGAAWVFTRSAGTWFQQGNKLVGTGAVNGDLGSYQGRSVALASDGNTALIGGPMDNTGAGAVWPFIRTGTLWSQQGAKLVGSGARGSSSQGESVSISTDGNTAIVGGPNDSTGEGAAWVFSRVSGAWSQQGDKLVGKGAVGIPNQAISVSLSSDGNTAVIGGPADSAGAGATWVFTRTLSHWNQQGSKLVGTGGVNGLHGSNQGETVALSGDGNTLIVGGPNDSTGSGAAWMFTRYAGTWSQQGNKLAGTGGTGKASLGASVSLSADGNTAMIGGPSDNSGAGSSWVFTRSAGAWSQQGGKLYGTGGVGNSGQGKAVSLSADGNTAMVGGANDNSGAGASWVFTRSGSVWSQKGGKLTGSDADESAGFGGSVSLSADGNTAIVGGSNDNAGAGAVWVFSRSGEGWIQSGSKIVGSGGAGNPTVGESVSLAGDGNTLIAGGPGDNSGAGAAWVFARKTSGVRGSDAAPGRTFALVQNYPNPFNPVTTIRFEIPSYARVRLSVYNTLGEKVTELANGPMAAGAHSVTFDASRLSSGAYICRLQVGTYVAARKLLLMK